MLAIEIFRNGVRLDFPRSSRCHALHRPCGALRFTIYLVVAFRLFPDSDFSRGTAHPHNTAIPKELKSQHSVQKRRKRRRGYRKGKDAAETATFSPHLIFLIACSYSVKFPRSQRSGATDEQRQKIQELSTGY